MSSDEEEDANFMAINHIELTLSGCESLMQKAKRYENDDIPALNNAIKTGNGNVLVLIFIKQLSTSRIPGIESNS